MLFLGFSKASTQQFITGIDDVKFKEIIQKLDLNVIKSSLSRLCNEQLKDVLSHYNADDLKEELASSSKCSILNIKLNNCK